MSDTARLMIAAGLTAAVLSVPAAGQADDLSGLSAFNGSAEAIAVRAVLTVRPATLTDTPFDGGGPTARVAVDSLGSSGGFAAFPDPGQAYVALPSTVSGAIFGGGGSPPVKPGTPPNYPFYVESDASTKPEDSVGAGPYVLSAASDARSSRASARTGFLTEAVGNLALATSTASLQPGSDGSVVASAVSHVEGLTVGPLSIGDIKSTAQIRAGPSGELTPATNLQINAMRIGAAPVQVKADGLVAGGPDIPLPINETLANTLKASGITIQLVAPRQPKPGSVAAPAIEIVMPYQAPSAGSVGGYTGTLTLIIGSANASLSAVGTAAPSTGLTIGDTRGESGGPPGQPSAPTVSDGPSPAISPTWSSPVPGPSLATGPADQGAAASPAPGSVALAVPAGQGSRPVGVVQTFDVGVSYLMLAIGSAALALVGALRRRLGVKP